MTEAPWASWLRTRFPAYLLCNAAGEPRGPEAVAEALSRFAHSRSAMTRLAQLGFLLGGPGGLTEQFVCRTVPDYLRRVRPSTERVLCESRGSVRGRPHWARTLDLRRRTHDPTWFVGTTPRRTYATPPLLLIRWLLEEVLSAIDDLRPTELSADHTGWLASLSAMHTAAARALSDAALRDLLAEPPPPERVSQCAQSHDHAVRLAASVAGWRSLLLPRPRREALAETIERYALTPLDENTRFEVYTALRAIDAISASLPTACRQDELILRNRRAIARWRSGAFALHLYFDQGAEKGTHAATMEHYFGAASRLRPDLRLVVRGPGVRRVLYLDAKNSVQISYLGSSLLKMHGYIADRARDFSYEGTKVVVVCPGPLRAPPRALDEVVFVGADDCGGRSSLATVLSDWLASARQFG